MKISQMLAREDFYKINDETLHLHFGDAQDTRKLYIYPQLNAIVTASPAKAVKNYLYCEYSVKSNFIKALAVKLYVALCLNTRGILAKKNCRASAALTDNMLIYPCNKKYRIFDFAKNTVDVIAKCGFPKTDLLREIEFRSQHSAVFIPTLLSFDENGYREEIIDGMPLARTREGFDEYCKSALSLLEDYATRMGLVRSENARAYAESLVHRIKEISIDDSKHFSRTALFALSEKLLSFIPDSETVSLTLSHGDLQPGNIWITAKKQIVIIDWESWGERSVDYDRATLYCRLRSGDLSHYINEEMTCKKAVVCLEDIVFHINEMYNLPLDYGETEFQKYITRVSESF